jgi:Ser/Thr protein kinase RdoA (MazF antagonist)
MTLTSISDADLYQALDAWRLPQPLGIQRITPGFTSEAWLVESAIGRYVAKYAYDSPATVEVGLHGAEILATHGFPAAAPLRTVSGTLTVPINVEGEERTIALLTAVPGSEIDGNEADAPELVGRDLGRLHAILLRHYPPPTVHTHLRDYIATRIPEVAAQPGLQDLIDQALLQLDAYEAQFPVTYGWIYGDWFDILRDSATGVYGWIDWGALTWGPLLFDVVYAVWQVGGGEADQRTHRLLAAYLAEAPIDANELRGIDVYAAMMLARGAKYFAWRLAHGVTLGDPDPNGNEQGLAEHRDELAKILAGEQHVLPAEYRENYTSGW